MRTEQHGQGAEAAKQSIFVVGQIRKGEQKLVFLHPATRPIFPGPWEIRAVLKD